QRLGPQTTVLTATSPFAALRRLLAELPCASPVGFITYDAIRFFEAIPDRHSNNHPLPDMLFNFYKTTLMFDHLQQKLLISMIVEITEDNLQQIYQQAQEKISALLAKIATPPHRATTSTI